MKIFNFKGGQSDIVKIIAILLVILWAVMFFITGIRLINWQNEYKNKDEQIKILEQSLNEQIEER